MERWACQRACLACECAHRVNTPGERAELEAVSIRLAHGRAEIERSIGEIEECVQVVEGFRRKYVHQVQLACDQVHAELRELQDFLKAALIEAESELQIAFSQGNRQPRSPLARQLLVGLPSPLFKFELTNTDFPTSFCRIETAESVWIDPGPLLLPGLWDGSLQIYDVVAKNCISLQQHELDAGTVLCMLEDRELLAIGGFPASNAVYRICAKTGSFTPLLPMIHPRGFAGVFPYSASVYIFGGLAESTLSHSEKYHLDLNVWHPLPALQEAKCAFTPCMLRTCLYLPEFQTCCALEEFSLAHATSRLLRVDMGELRGWAVAWVEGGELVVVTSQGQQGRWRPGRGGFEVNSVDVKECSVQTCSRARTWEGLALWSEVTGVVVLDKETMQASCLDSIAAFS